METHHQFGPCRLKRQSQPLMMPGLSAPLQRASMVQGQALTAWKAFSRAPTPVDSRGSW